MTLICDGETIALEYRPEKIEALQRSSRHEECLYDAQPKDVQIGVQCCLWNKSKGAEMCLGRRNERAHTAFSSGLASKYSLSS